ncbi:MAG: Gfo/Idh/MocA family protein [Povalibacter sp.]
MSAFPRLQPLTHARRTRLGFVGVGWIGRKRLDVLARDADVEVAAICDADATRMHDAARTYPQAACVQQIESLLELGVDGVVIATPNGMHAQQAIACLEKGVPVFCQKPLATNALDVEHVIAAALQNDRLLGIDFCYRHVAGMSELRRRIRNGELGEIVAIDLRFHNAYGPDKAWCHDRNVAGGGCLLDLGVHLLDLAMWVQDFPPLERVRSRLFTRGEPLQSRDEVEDLAFAEFIQPNGALVRLACSWHANTGRDAIIDMAITGSRAGAYWENVNGSFYEFELNLCRGASKERLSQSPDEWGPRALRRWTDRLAVDRSFDPEIEHVARSALLIEETYRA